LRLLFILETMAMLGAAPRPNRGPCRDGFECLRRDCHFEHAQGRRIDAVADPVLFRLHTGEELRDRLRAGMLHQLNHFLRPLSLEARVGERDLEIMGLPLEPWLHRTREEVQQVADDVQEEVLRLASLRQLLTERLPMMQRYVPRFIGPRGLTQQMLSRDLGVELRVSNSQGRDPDAEAVLEVTGAPEALDRAMPVLQEHLISLMQTMPFHSQVELQLESEVDRQVHIFVDLMNTSRGCRLMPDGRQDVQQRISIRRFVEVLCGARSVLTRRVLLPPADDGRGNHLWQAQDFEVGFGDGLPAAFASVLRRRPAPRETLVLCTGDGACLGAVRTALWCGWCVELWCWRASCHPTYSHLAEDHRGLRICYLDGLRRQVTFQQLDGEPTQAEPEPAQAEPAQPAPPQAPPEPAEGPEPDLCAVCMDGEATWEFIPCQHLTLCSHCAREVAERQNARPYLRRCFVCRARWRSIRRRA